MEKIKTILIDVSAGKQIVEEIECENTSCQETTYIHNYGEAINAKIRERYTESQEFAILRQKDEKPEEYAEYYAYCEKCKNAVKESM